MIAFQCDECALGKPLKAILAELPMLRENRKESDDV